MRILFDHGAPAPLIPFLEGHTVTKAKDAGWDKLVNGELLKAAEEAGFALLLTTDKNMASQQNLKSRRIAIVVLGNSQWRIVQRYVRRIAASVNAATPGSCVEVDIPFRWRVLQTQTTRKGPCGSSEIWHTTGRTAPEISASGTSFPHGRAPVAVDIPLVIYGVDLDRAWKSALRASSIR